ncbi:MAG: hypothetical protein IT410_02580, partial [Candidatus Doudnabacteria bacterium]|nr:hypothetical protein [Candidatus Doudnabacteria bacterium]
MEHTNEHDETEKEETPKRSKRKTGIMVAGVVLIIVLILAIGIGWLYTGQLNDTKSKVFSNVPLPAAVVNTYLIPMTDVLHRYDIAKQVLGEDEADSQKNELYTQILERLIADAQSKAQANKI